MSKQSDLLNLTDAISVSGSNVGIGTSSPRVKLDLRSDAVIAAPTPLANAVTSGVFAIGDSVGSVVGLQLNGSSYDTYIQSRNMGAGSAAYNLLLQPLGGNVGIGASSPAAKLDIVGAASTSTFRVATAETRGVEIILGDAYGSTGPIINCTTNAGLIVRSQTAGVSLSGGATAWASVSDERNKENLAPITDAINKVNSLRAVTGKYKTDDAGTSRSFLIAQDVQAVLPEAIDIGKDEDKTLSLRYTDVIPLLTAALQEALTEISALKVRVAALEAN